MLLRLSRGLLEIAGIRYPTSSKPSVDAGRRTGNKGARNPLAALKNYLGTVTGIPIMGQIAAMARATTTIRITLAMLPYIKNSPGVNCFES